MRATRTTARSSSVSLPRFSMCRSMASRLAICMIGGGVEKSANPDTPQDHSCIWSPPEKNGRPCIDVDALLLLADWLEQRSSAEDLDVSDNGGQRCRDQRSPPAPSAERSAKAVATDTPAGRTLATRGSRPSTPGHRSPDDHASSPASGNTGGDMR